MEISYGQLEVLAGYSHRDLASAFFSIATPEQVERVATSLGANFLFGEDNEIIGIE